MEVQPKVNRMVHIVGLILAVPVLWLVVEMEAGNESSYQKDSSTPALQVLPPKHGLPSFDPYCLSVLAYSRFGSARLHVCNTYFSRWNHIISLSPIPNLIHGEQKFNNVESIIDYFRELNFGTDFNLSKKECADALAFLELMDVKLKPALLHTYWLEQDNYDKVTREMYAETAGLPSTICYPRKLKQKAFDTVYTAAGGLFDLMKCEAIEKKIYHDAVVCMTSLSDKLGSHPFLFGDKPTTVDAVMFGYLAPLLRIPFPKSRLKGHLESFQNLCNTINYIFRRYFSAPEEGVQRSVPVNNSEGIYEVDEFPNEKRDIFIAAVFAVTVLVSYVLLRSGISIRVLDDGEDQ